MKTTQPKAANKMIPEGKPERPNRCFSCGEFRLLSTCRFRNAVCHSCGKLGHVHKICRQFNCNVTSATHEDQETDDGLVYTLKISSESNQHLGRSSQFQCALRHQLIMGTGSCKPIILKSVLDLIQPSVPIHLTAVRIRGITGHRHLLLHETALMVLSEGDYTPIRCPISIDSPSILSLKALRASKESETPKPASDNPLIQLVPQQLVAQCSNNKNGMAVEPEEMEVVEDLVFLKRQVLPCSQNEGVLKVLTQMEQGGFIACVTSSAWATPIVESDGQTLRICGDNQLTLKLRLRKCAATKWEP